MANKKTVKPKVQQKNEIIDFSKISNDEIKNYIRDIEIQKERQSLLDERLKEEDNKIDILNKNISKLDLTNVSLEKQANKVRNLSTSLSGQIAELQLDLEKAQSESKLKRVKQIKSDILVNAKILKSQEDTINKLRARREEMKLEQDAQRNRLLEKREQIEALKNDAIQNEFKNTGEELLDIIESTLASNVDKTQIMSAALKEASAEMKKFKDLDAINNSATNDNIELLKTRMLEINGLNNHNSNSNYSSQDYNNRFSQASHNAQNGQTNTRGSISPKTSRDIEAETKLVSRLDKLVNDGLITNEDKFREIEKFNQENSMRRLSPEQNQNIKSQKKISKRQQKKIDKLNQKNLKSNNNANQIDQNNQANDSNYSNETVQRPSTTISFQTQPGSVAQSNQGNYDDVNLANETTNNNSQVELNASQVNEVNSQNVDIKQPPISKKQQKKLEKLERKKLKSNKVKPENLKAEKIKAEKVKVEKVKRERKPLEISKGKVITIIILILLQLGIIATIVLFALGIVEV